MQEDRRLFIYYQILFFSEIDYYGRFFSKHCQRLIEHRFNHNKDSLFKNKVAIFDEAVDKIAFYSPLLHILYVYIGINGVRIDDVLSFILFFHVRCIDTFHCFRVPFHFQFAQYFECLLRRTWVKREEKKKTRK